MHTCYTVSYTHLDVYKRQGITGTKGKSTVAEFVYRILNDSGRKAGIIGTCGIRFGAEERTTGNTTPDALELASVFAEMCSAGMEYVVMEVSSQACLLDRIYGLHFDRAVFTNLYYDHIGPVSYTHLLYRKIFVVLFLIRFSVLLRSLAMEAFFGLRLHSFF